MPHDEREDMERIGASFEALKNSEAWAIIRAYIEAETTRSQGIALTAPPETKTSTLRVMFTKAQVWGTVGIALDDVIEERISAKQDVLEEKKYERSVDGQPDDSARNPWFADTDRQ